MRQVPALVALFVLSLSTPTRADADIRTVDFQNFTFHPTLCAREFGDEGIGKTVRVRKGEWTGKSAYYSVRESVVYADLNGDGQDEAIVQADCAPTGANFSYFEMLIFGMKGGHPSVIATLDHSRLQTAYDQQHRDGMLWRAEFKEVKSDHTTIVLVSAAEGAHCCPEYSVTFEYQLKGGKLIPVGKPRREPFKP